MNTKTKAVRDSQNYPIRVGCIIQDDNGGEVGQVVEVRAEAIVYRTLQDDRAYAVGAAAPTEWTWPHQVTVLADPAPRRALRGRKA